MAEIEKFKRKREERAIKKALHEEEMAMHARKRARAEFHDWEKKEEEFLLHQSKVKSGIIQLREEQVTADEDDACFGNDYEVNVDSHAVTSWWHDRYQPRKPKYMNRVCTLDTSGTNTTGLIMIMNS